MTTAPVPATAQLKSSQRDLKFEARNPKSETNSNDQKQMQCSKQTRFGFLVLDFPGLEFILASVCFEFRASDFGFTHVGFVSVRGAAFVLRISDFPWRACWRGKFVDVVLSNTSKVRI
jgi:hypothetical protein